VYKLQGNSDGGLTQLPDGRFMLFKVSDGKLISMTSTDGSNWVHPKIEIEKEINLKEYYNGIIVVDKEGELHRIFQKFRAVPQYANAPKPKYPFQYSDTLYDIWHCKTTNARTRWEPPKVIFEGYTADVLDFKQLRNGRLIFAFGYWIEGTPRLPRGEFTSSVMYSDDGGNKWKWSDAKLTSPAYEGYNGNNYGAIEGAFLEMENTGNLYQLFRTQTGFLYESSSTDNGTTWTQPKATRFRMFDGPPLLKELPDKRVFLVWNNCDNSPKHNGKGVYGGRDALHAAISDDYGKTWRGFREIHRDPYRNETPPKRGDRGTAYSNSPIGVDGKIMLITGMGKDRRHIVFIDPAWLTEKHHESDFSKGLDEWHVFKHFGPASGWWRDREAGAELVQHPSKPKAKVLHIRRSDEKDPDGAVWNFPNGRSGKLSVRIMLNKGFMGGNIALTDRFFNPADCHGERLAMFSLPIKANGQIGSGSAISPDKWHTLDFKWDIDENNCEVFAGGKLELILPLRNKTLNGLSYLRLRSTATSIDKVGYYIESIKVDILDNLAPAVSEKEILAMETAYRTELSNQECPLEAILKK